MTDTLVYVAVNLALALSIVIIGSALVGIAVMALGWVAYGVTAAWVGLSDRRRARRYPGSEANPVPHPDVARQSERKP